MAATSGGTEAEIDQIQEITDINILHEYILKLVTLVLEDGKNSPYPMVKCLKDPSNVNLMKKFLGETQPRTLMIERLSAKDESDDSDDTEVDYMLSVDVHYSNGKATGLVLIKRGAVVTADKSLSSQLCTITLTEDSPYETLHSLVSCAVAPFFKSYVRESGKIDREGDKMAPSVENKIAEVEMGLLHLQQNIDIPEITLTAHPSVVAIIKKCQAEGRRARVQDFGDKVEDSTYLNALQTGVNRWIREIQKVTKLDRDPSSGTAMQEISFWLNLERSLLRIQEIRESPEITLTLDILKHGKRFHATVSFDTDTGLKQAIDKVNDYNPLMKDFPLNDLLAATELIKIRQALVAIFSHMRKIRNCQQYPGQRALSLIEAISRDLMGRLLKVLGTQRLMHISYDEFEKVMIAAFEVFTTWDDEYEKLQGLMRDILKKKRDEQKKMMWRLTPIHKKLQARLDHMRRFRRQHEQLRSVIIRVLRPQRTSSVSGSLPTTPDGEGSPEKKMSLALMETNDAAAIEEVNLAYQNVKEVDCLDVNKEGTDVWEEAVRRYNERIDRVEARITARLRDQLGTAKNANEMFHIFSRFNALFVRPHIRGAIREYQTQLIQRVKDDIESLHEKFKKGYAGSKDEALSRKRDLPPVASSIIWARQIEKKLTAYMRRVEDVLGKGWENHVEGQKLKQDGENFKNKLDTKLIFEEWAQKVQQRNIAVSGHIFAIETTRAHRTGRAADGQKILRPRVNFQPEIITLAKEVRNLKWLGFRIPLAIVNKAHQANQLYPFAVSLMESVRTYESVLRKIEERPGIAPLLAQLKKDLHATFMEGIQLVWESYKLDPYVQKFAEQVFNFEEKVEELLEMDDQITAEVRSLDTCQYNFDVFSQIIGQIQKRVDDLNLHSFSNLTVWVRKLDQTVEEKLSARLEAALLAWNAALLGNKQNKKEEEDGGMGEGDGEGASKQQHRLGGDPKLKQLVYEMRVKNQVIYAFPNINMIMKELIHDLHSWENHVLRLPRILSTRYQVGAEHKLTDKDLYYRECLTKMPSGPVAMQRCYESIINLYDELKSTMQQLGGDLAAAESECVERQIDLEEELTIAPSRSFTAASSEKRSQEADIVKSLRKKLAKSGSIMKNMSKSQQQPLTARTAFANYVRDSLLTMSKTSYRKARSSMNRVLSELMDDSDDDLPFASPLASPVRPLQHPMQHSVRPSSAPSCGSSDQFLLGSQWDSLSLHTQMPAPPSVQQQFQPLHQHQQPGPSDISLSSTLSAASHVLRGDLPSPPPFSSGQPSPPFDTSMPNVSNFSNLSRLSSIVESSSEMGKTAGDLNTPPHSKKKYWWFQ